MMIDEKAYFGNLFQNDRTIDYRITVNRITFNHNKIH